MKRLVIPESIEIARHDPELETHELIPDSDFAARLELAFENPLHRSLGGRIGTSPEDLSEREQYFSPHATVPENIKIRSFESPAYEHEVATEYPQQYMLLLAQAVQRLEIVKGLSDPGVVATQQLERTVRHETTHGKMAKTFGVRCRFGVRVLYDQNDNIWALSPFHALLGNAVGEIMLTRLEEAAIAIAPEDASPADLYTATSLGYCSREEVMERLYELRPDLQQEVEVR